MANYKQPWLASPTKDSIFILAPLLVPVALIFIFQKYFLTHEVNTLWWIILVLGVDVSHVYSTLFRFYWDKQIFTRYKSALLTIPAIAFVLGFSLHNYNAMLFWRLLAYLAVFHFVRQQYGFMRLYARKDLVSKSALLIDNLSIYNATVYPILYWHFYATDKLMWFVKGDFFNLSAFTYGDIFFALYIAILILYFSKEILSAWARKTINIPKNLVMAGTYLSWYVGIVSFQGDLIFTILNVVSHGIPYMALIWIYGEKKTTKSFSFNSKGLVIFITTLLVLAYLEESLWDGIIWKDHIEIFPLLAHVHVLQNSVFVSAMVALLALPQITHYVVDGFIWRFSKHASAKLD